MKKIIILTCVFCFVMKITHAQQLPFTTQFTQGKFLWNPAFTAVDDKMKATAFTRQQWVAIEGAPRTIFASIEYPFIDYNMSAGAAIISDKTGPISKTGLQLMYNYKLNELIGDEDRLSFGIQAAFAQFAFNSTNEQYNDRSDPLISGANNSKGFPTVGAGFAYISSIEEWDNNTVFYIGGAFQQAYTTNLLVNSADFERTMHSFFNLGTKIYALDLMFEPYVNLNYTNPEILNYSLNFNLEMEDLFWAGLGVSNASELSLQGGYIMDDIGSRYAQLRLGLQANIIASSTAASLGPGFEVYVGYLFDLD